MKPTKFAKSLPYTASDMPQKPKRWVYRHENEILRAFCGYAISQHPFHRPPNLFKAADDLIRHLTRGQKHNLDVLRMHSGTLGRRIQEFCLKHPAVVRWNKPRRGNPRFMFTSRHWQPKPEYDFIDLHALAANVTRQLIREDF